MFRERYSLSLAVSNKLHNARDWEPYLDDQTRLNHLFWDSNTPQWCVDIIWQAARRKPEAQFTKSQLYDLLGSPMSLGKFNEGIKEAKSNSAPGMSGLSYNMLKSLQDKIVDYYNAGFAQFWLSNRVVAS